MKFIYKVGGTRMIDNFTIKEVASYDKTGIRISLNKINYIFGTNGTGKTTISEFLRNSYHPKYSSCKIKWKPGSSNLDIYVYNRHFVNENFNVSNEIKGIFTLGKESTDIMKKIDNINEEIEKHREKIEILEINIEKKGREIEELQNNFMEQCWAIKQKYDTVFKEAFIGLRNNKRKFMERFLDEAANNKNNLYTYDELLKRVTSVFKSIKEKINPIQEVNYDLSLENHPIYKTKIIGKSDLDIGKLISELNISDWVRQGHKHLDKTNGKCPFCQQVLPTNFKEKLEKYFDETYTNQIKTLNEAIKNYKSELNDLIEKYNIMVKENNPFINKDKITSLLTLINSTFNENVQLLENKIKEPSINIRLKSLKEYIEQLDLEIKQVNLQIREHNRIIENIIDEKQKLINDIWRFLVDENKSYYKSYMENFSRENKALSGMKKKKEQKEHHKRKFEEEKIKLLNKLTSFLPSINEINNLLKSFGFTNFYLAESDKKGYYKIIRENGEDANETLSEGEKTFITFLYFYQLINGSNERTRVETPRIIVIDDPVSSLDSNVLFIVSSLINNIKQRIRENDHIFKQLIILTHNVYFHKEITFNKNYRKKKMRTFGF